MKYPDIYELMTISVLWMPSSALRRQSETAMRKSDGISHATNY